MQTCIHVYKSELFFFYAKLNRKSGFIKQEKVSFFSSSSFLHNTVVSKKLDQERWKPQMIRAYIFSITSSYDK